MNRRGPENADQSAQPPPTRDLAHVVEAPVVVLCVGNLQRGDDGFGPAVAERLGARPDVIDAGTTPENELPRLAGRAPRTVVIVDAVHFGGRPGELRVLAPADLRFDEFTTHAASLELCAAFLREAAGARTVVLAAQPTTVAFGAPMSAEMGRAVEDAADLLERALA